MVTVTVVGLTDGTHSYMTLCSPSDSTSSFGSVSTCCFGFLASNRTVLVDSHGSHQWQSTYTLALKSKSISSVALL